MRLNEFQKAAVSHKEGPALVLAGPGSGKTTVIAHRIRALIEEAGVRPEHIELGAGIEGKVDVSEMMGSSVHLHVTSMGRDVVLVVSTMNMTGAEVAALSNGSTVNFTFPGHVCHLFNKETGINLEA